MARSFRTIAAATTIGLLAVLASCGAGQVDGVSEKDRFRIALVMKSLANEFFVTMAAGAEAHQAGHSEEYELLINGLKNESDLGEQVALMEQMISIGVDAIVFAPTDSKALVPVARRAQQAGIVVINIDNKLDAEILALEGVTISFVGPDNREGARAVGDRLARDLAVGDEVAIIGGIPTAFNAQQRQLGFEDAMRAAAVKILAVQSGGWEQTRANTAAAALISEHPNLKAILCSNDSMALGAAAAIRHAGKDGEILLVGFDNIAAIGEMVRDGRVLATADQHADQLAVFGIEAALAILRGEAVPEDRQTPVDLITAETL